MESRPGRGFRLGIVPTLLSIGEFAQLTHLSIRTLRRYHDTGLLAPARVDDATGYRYYEAEQIPAAQVIHRLRQLDVPLAEVRRVLSSRDPAERADLIARHLQRLEDQMERTRIAVASLQRLLRPEPAALRVELRQVPAATVAAVEATVDLDEVLGWYAGAMAELDAAVPAPAGTPGGPYDNELSAAPGAGGEPIHEWLGGAAVPHRAACGGRVNEQLLRELAPAVHGVLVRRGADFASAEDAVQEALIRALDAWPAGQPRDPKGRLVSVAWRTFLDAARAEKARASGSTRWRQSHPAAPCPPRTTRCACTSCARTPPCPPARRSR